MKKTFDISLINQINKKMNSMMSIGDLLLSILMVAKDVLQSEKSSILLTDQLTGDLVFHLVYGKHNDILLGEKIPYGKGIAGAVARQKAPMIVNDPQKHPEFYPEIDKLTGSRTKSVLCIPLLITDELIGVLHIVNSKKKTGFDESDLPVAQYIAYQAASAISSRRLYDDFKDRINELTSLYSLSQSLLHASKFGSFFETTVQSIARTMKVRRVSILLYDKYAKKLKMETSCGLPEPVAKGTAIKNTPSVSRYVFENEIPLLVSSVMKDLPASLKSANAKYASDSFLSVPICYGSIKIGVLNLSDKTDGKPFDSFDLRILSIISNQIAEVYSNLQERKIRNEFEFIFISIIIMTCIYTFLIFFIMKIKAQYPDYSNVIEYNTHSLDIVFLIIMGMIIRKSGLPLATFGVTLKNAKKSVAESLASTGVILIVMAVIKYLLIMKGVLFTERDFFSDKFNGWAILLCFLSPLQEFVSRGVMQGSIERIMNRPLNKLWAIMLTSLLFGIFHLYISLTLGLISFAISLYYGVLYIRHRTLIGVSLSHILINIAALVLGYWEIIVL